MATLTLDQVSKIYGPLKGGIRAVDTIGMTIGDGEIIGLLGSSGCGKTSTLRMIAGFESVSEGEIRLGERVINRLMPAERNVAMAFEGYALYPPLRIRDNIGFALLRDREAKASVRTKVDEVAELLQINEILERYPPTISAGQQQRASLARALIRNADAFLLDEPMSQLEPQLRAVLRARIKEWLIRRKMTTVFVTHDQTEAIALADRIAVMEKGILQQFASPAELKERPANLFVAGFIGEPPMNLFPARLATQGGEAAVQVENNRGEAAFEIVLPRSALPDGIGRGTALHLGIRPHRVQIGRSEHGLRGTVTSNHWLGDQSHVGLDVGGCLLIAVTDGRLDAPIGSEVAVELPTWAIHLFDAESEQAVFHGTKPAGGA